MVSIKRFLKYFVEAAIDDFIVIIEVLFYVILCILSITLGFLIFSMPVFVISYLIVGDFNQAFGPAFIFGIFGAVWGIMLPWDIMERYEEDELRKRLLSYCELEHGNYIIDEYVIQKKQAEFIKEQVRKLVREYSKTSEIGDVDSITNKIVNILSDLKSRLDVHGKDLKDIENISWADDIGYIIECCDGVIVTYNPLDDYVSIELLEYVIKSLRNKFQ